MSLEDRFLCNSSGQRYLEEQNVDLSTLTSHTAVYICVIFLLYLLHPEVTMITIAFIYYIITAFIGDSAIGGRCACVV